MFILYHGRLVDVKYLGRLRNFRWGFFLVGGKFFRLVKNFFSWWMLGRPGLLWCISLLIHPYATARDAKTAGFFSNPAVLCACLFLCFIFSLIYPLILQIFHFQALTKTLYVLTGYKLLGYNRLFLQCLVPVIYYSYPLEIGIYLSILRYTVQHIQPLFHTVHKYNNYKPLFYPLFQKLHKSF